MNISCSLFHRYLTELCVLNIANFYPYILICDNNSVKIQSHRTLPFVNVTSIEPAPVRGNGLIFEVSPNHLNSVTLTMDKLSSDEIHQLYSILRLPCIFISFTHADCKSFDDSCTIDEFKKFIQLLHNFKETPIKQEFLLSQCSYKNSKYEFEIEQATKSHNHTPYYIIDRHQKRYFLVSKLQVL